MVLKKSGTYAPWILMILATVPVVILLLQGLQPAPPPPPTLPPAGGPRRTTSPKVVDRINGLARERNTPSRETEPTAEPFPPSHFYRGIEGRVKDEVTGNPVPAFTVYYCRESPDDPTRTIELTVRLGEQARAFRRADGRFKIMDLDEGVYDIAIKAMGYPVHYVRGIEVPSKKERSLEIPLPRGNYIEGKVVDTAGRPVDKAMVYLKVEALDNPDDLPPARRAARTGGDGAFLFGGLPPGRYGLCLNSMQHPLAKEEGLYVGGGGIYRELLMPDLSGLEITVTDPFGHPLPNASIRLWERNGSAVISMKTDMNGRAYRRMVPPGDYDLRIWKSTYEPHAEKDFKILPGSGIIRVRKVLRKGPGG